MDCCICVVANMRMESAHLDIGHCIGKGIALVNAQRFNPEFLTMDDRHCIACERYCTCRRRDASSSWAYGPKQTGRSLRVMSEFVPWETGTRPWCRPGSFFVLCPGTNWIICILSHSRRRRVGFNGATVSRKEGRTDEVESAEL